MYFMETTKHKIPFKQIEGILEHIESTDQLITQLLKAGEKEEGLAIRQYRHLRNDFRKQLHHILSKHDLLDKVV